MFPLVVIRCKGRGYTRDKRTTLERERVNEREKITQELKKKKEKKRYNITKKRKENTDDDGKNKLKKKKKMVKSIQRYRYKHAYHITPSTAEIKRVDRVFFLFFLFTQ